MRPTSTTRRLVRVISSAGEGCAGLERRDTLATEEPLEIRILDPEATPIAVTMRTPGADFPLAAGFLFGEGILNRSEEVASIRYCVDADGDGPQLYNVVNVRVASGVRLDRSKLQRNFYATSSCGVCGKASIEAVSGAECPRLTSELSVDPEVVLGLPARLRERQRIFDRTGGLHAAALFDARGALLSLDEDVGRHNALDKLIGRAWLEGGIPLTDRIVLVSGRLSFELVQKAARAGIPLLAGVSAPSSLAVQLAESVGMTLVGFLREKRFNVYTGAERVLLRRAVAATEEGR
jgi:FdhD protein